LFKNDGVGILRFSNFY